MSYKLYCGDCLEVMQEIGSGSVDAVIADPPYGTTACKWDSVIPLEEMWEQLKRVIKLNGAIVMTASQPFTTVLITSNMDMFKYCWVWEKSKGCNFVQAKNMPIRFTEDIVVFSSAPIGHIVQLGKRRMTYNPQGLIEVNKQWNRPRKYNSEHRIDRKSHKLSRTLEYENYPKDIIKINNSDNRERGLHPTQKPVALMSYLIRTYTNPNDTVLDFAMGSGSTGVACIQENRNFIGIELLQEYVDIADERIEQEVKRMRQLEMFE